MAASYIKTSKSSANFANVLEEPMKTYKWLLLFHEHFLCLDNQCTASDVAPCTREIRIPGSDLTFFVSISGQLEEIIIKNRK